MTVILCTTIFCLYKTPFVLGTSVPPVRSMAWRIASARALKADSALANQGVNILNLFKTKNCGTDLWWSFSPRKTSTCNVTPAAIANEWNTWGIISVDRSPIFSRFSRSSATQYGRPEMSITARERAYVRRLVTGTWDERFVAHTSSKGAWPVP